MGLIKEGEHVRVLSDILGDEDHLGDMDFKVAGTPNGVTSLQMDIKISGVNRDIMRQALYQAREGRLHILGIMTETMGSHRASVSGHAPRITTLKVRPDKIREIIGPGGKVIRGIIEATGVKMDVEDDGTVTIASSDEAASRKAIEMVQRIAAEAEVGKIYKGTVRKIVDFGAFVEILPGTDGLVHISQLAPERVRRVSDVLKEGDEVLVKVLEIDKQGKIRLSRKEALQDTGNGPSGAVQMISLEHSIVSSQLSMFAKAVLDNGIRVVTQEMPDHRSVSLGIWVENGSRHEAQRERDLPFHRAPSIQRDRTAHGGANRGRDGRGGWGSECLYTSKNIPAITQKFWMKTYRWPLIF